MKKDQKKHAAGKKLGALTGAAARSPKAADQGKTTTEAPKQRDDSGEVVVFAIRLKRSERDEIHASAGSAKASAFVRGLAVAAARGDLKAVTEIVEGLTR